MKSSESLQQMAHLSVHHTCSIPQAWTSTAQLMPIMWQGRKAESIKLQRESLTGPGRKECENKSLKPSVGNKQPQRHREGSASCPHMVITSWLSDQAWSALSSRSLSASCCPYPTSARAGARAAFYPGSKPGVVSDPDAMKGAL